MWLAETKGEIRTNTALKSQAAQLWCEKMSGTKYGQWQFMFVQSCSVLHGSYVLVAADQQTVRAQMRLSDPAMEAGAAV